MVQSATVKKLPFYGRTTGLNLDLYLVSYYNIYMSVCVCVCVCVCVDVHIHIHEYIQTHINFVHTKRGRNELPCLYM